MANRQLRSEMRASTYLGTIGQNAVSQRTLVKNSILTLEILIADDRLDVSG